MYEILITLTFEIYFFVWMCHSIAIKRNGYRIESCVWDKSTQELQTREEIVNRKEQQDYTTASWYSNTFDLSELKVGKKDNMPSQLLFDLDETKSL